MSHLLRVLRGSTESGKTSTPLVRPPPLPLHWLALAAITLVGGCATGPAAAERAARQHVSEVTRAYRPAGKKPSLPALAAGAPLEDYIRFALLNHPRVEAAYYDWRASVEAIAPARALPDPKITFEA